MGDETLFETEGSKSRAEIAHVLGSVAAELAGDGPVRLEADGRSVTVHPPERPTFEVEVERETEDDTTETSIEFEIEWDETDGNEPVVRDSAADEPALADEPETPVELDPEPRSLARFELFRDRADEWRWRLVHRNGNIIATSGEGYTRKANALKGARSVRRNAPGATFVTK